MFSVEIDPELKKLIIQEGDFEEWRDEYSGYLCRIRRIKSFSCWCGYVRVPDSHNTYNSFYNNVDVEVHGGLTYGSDRFPDSDKKDDCGYWFGFDCGHAGDLIPYLWKNGVYRTKEYVKEECKNLAKQLKEMEGC